MVEEDLDSYLDGKYPEKLSTEQAVMIASGHDDIVELAAHLHSEGQVSDSGLRQSESDEILGMLLFEIATQMESYDAAREYLDRGFPTMVVEDD